MITPEQIDTYKRDGVVILRGLFTDWVDDLRAGVEANMANPTWRERSYQPADGTAKFFQDFCNWAVIPQYRRFVEESGIAESAARLMRSKTARIFHDHVLVKEPGSSIPTPWHQDDPYYLVSADQSISFWIPLDPVPRDLCAQYVAGSHAWGKVYRPQRFDGSNLYEGDTSELMPDIDADRDAYDIVYDALEPGDCIAFHFRSVHGAPANHTAGRRRVVSLRWVGDDAVFVERKGPTSPHFPDLKPVPGAPFEGPDFPVIYPR